MKKVALFVGKILQLLWENFQDWRQFEETHTKKHEKSCTFCRKNIPTEGNLKKHIQRTHKKVALFVGKILQLLWELVIEKTVPPESQIWHFKGFFCVFPAPLWQNQKSETTLPSKTFQNLQLLLKKLFSTMKN